MPPNPILLILLSSLGFCSAQPLLRRRDLVVIPADESPESRAAVLVDPEDTWILEEETEAVLRILSGSSSLSIPAQSDTDEGAGRTDPDDPTPAPTSLELSTSAPTASIPSPSTIAPTASRLGPVVSPTPTTPAPITPAPATPAPITPAPATPAPITPAPATSAPITLAPIAPITTAPVTPTPIAPPVSNDAACFLSIDMSCTVSPGSIPCTEIAYRHLQCHTHPTKLSFRYNGGSCQQSSNLQGGATPTFLCQDYRNGPDTVSPVFIRAMYRPDDIFFQGFVSPGDVVALFDGGNALNKVSGFLSVNIYSSADASALTRLQSLTLRSDCSQGLGINDKFGSLELASYRDGDGASYPRLELAYAISNNDLASTAKLTWLETETNFGPGGFVIVDGLEPIYIESGGGLDFLESIDVDLTEQNDYTLTTVADAKKSSGDYCTALSSVKFSMSWN